MAEKVGRESPFKGVMEKLSSIESMVEKISGMKADIDIDTSDIDKANDELDKFNEKLAEAQKTLQRFKSTGQIHYFATQEKALAHLTRAWEEYKKASSEDDKKTASGKLMRWANAYRGAGYSTDSVEKGMFETADRIYESYKTTGKKGESNSQKLWAKDVFEKVFGAAREVGVDITESDKYWERRARNIRETAKKVTQESVEQVKSEPVELDVAELLKIDESGLDARVKKIMKSLRKIRDKLIDENNERTDKSLGKNQGPQFLTDYEEFLKYRENSGDKYRIRGIKKTRGIVLEEMGLKDTDEDLAPFKIQAKQNLKKALEKANRAARRAQQQSDTMSAEGPSAASTPQTQSSMTKAGEDARAAGQAASDAAQSFEEAGDKAQKAGKKAAASAEETREAAEETKKAAKEASEAQDEASVGRGGNKPAEDARETAAALNEERDAARGVNEERERIAAASGSGDNTASRAHENADALEEERKAQQEVNEERSKGDKTSGQNEEPLSYLDAMILKLEEEKEKLKELQDESDKTRKMLDAASDVKELKKAREIIHGVVKNNQTGETKRNAFGFEGNPAALGSLVRKKISEGNMAKAAAYYGEYAKAGGTDKFSDITGKDITAELAERYKQAAEAIGKNPDELRKALNEVNKKILTQREVVSQIEKEVKAAQKEAAAQRKEQAQQEQETNTDWRVDLNEQEIEAVEAYLKKMKALKKEAYNESTALAQAMSLLEKIKKRDISGLMDKFTAPNQASNAMLGKMTNMSVNNQKARNAALRSLNQEEYDRLIQEQTQAVNDALDNKKSDFQQKWAEVADAMLGGDAFADAKPMVKGQILKELEKYADTAKDAIDEINKQWLSGTLDESKFSGKYAKQYIQMLNDARDDAQIKREAKVGELDPDSLFSSGGTTALTQEQIDALHAEAAAYDELIAKKKEYYGIKEESYEPPEKLLNISYKAGNGRMQVDLSKLLPANQSDFKQLLDIVKLEDSQAAYEDNIKRVNDYINDMIKQAKRWLSKGEGRPWDPQNNPFDQAVAQNFGQMSSSKASGVLKKFQGYSGVLYQSMAKDLRVPKELSQVNADLFEQVKSGALDAIEAVELLRQKMQDFYNPPSTSSSSNASTFAADIKSLEGYSSANEDFVNQLIADVITGQKEYDQAMNELKAHIAQRQEEIRAEEELRAKRVRNAGFGEDVKALENYGYADKDFVQKLTAQVLEGAKEYDDAMDELKAHIEQKHAEMMAAAEKSERDNAEIARYDELAKPMLEQMGFTDSRPEGFYRFVEAIREEGIDAEEALKRFADTVGYVYDEVAGKWQKITESGVGGQTTSKAITSTQELISTVKELEEIYGKFQRPKYEKMESGQYIDQIKSVEGIDLSEYDSVHATEENIEKTRQKMMEIYSLYKKITSAIKNNAGYYKGVQYTEQDQDALINDFKAYAQNYHELVTQYNDQEGRISEEIGISPEYLETLDVVVQKLTRDFKAYAQEVITDSQAVAENDRLYEEEQKQLAQSNAALKERYILLRDLVIDYAKKQGADRDQLDRIQDLIPYISDSHETYTLLNEWGESLFGEKLSDNVLQDILKILGIEIPEAAGKAKKAISEVGEGSDQPSGQERATVDADALDKKVAELQYLHDKVRTIFDGKDGIINENMTYDEKFNSAEVQRMIELLSQLSDAELKAAGVMPDDEGSYDSFRQNLQERISLIKEAQDEIQKVIDGQSDEDRTELDLNIARQLEEIYSIAEEVGAKFESRLTPAVREFMSLIQGQVGSDGMFEFLNRQNIDRYIQDILSGAKTAKEAFADLENAFGWDTDRFVSLIDGEVPEELKGLYDSLFKEVENRIKTAEQAADIFNEKLKEIQEAAKSVNNESQTESETPNRKFRVSATTPHAAKATYIKRTTTPPSTEPETTSDSAAAAAAAAAAAEKEKAAKEGAAAAAEKKADAEKKDSEATRENAAENWANTDVEDLGEDISDVGGRAAEAVGNLDSFTESAKNAAEAARKAAGIEGESRIISKSGVNGTNASATYELARGMHYTENWSYRNGNEETGEEPGWAMTSARYVINYQALLNDTVTTLKALRKAEADLALAQEQGRGENVTSQIQAQIDLYQKRIDQNATLAEQYEKMRDLEIEDFELRDGYTKRQYDEDLKAQEELINAQSGAKKAKSVDDERKRQAAKQDKEVARAQKYATERLVALKQLESSFTTEGSSRYLSVEGDRTAITDMAGKLRTKLEDIIKQNRAMTIDEMDDIIAKFGDIKVEGDTRYARSTAKKGDLSRQKVDSLKNVLSSDLDAFSQQAQRSSGDISHITEEVNKLKEALNGNVSSEFITESFQKLRELRAELKAINEEQRTKTSTEKARQAEIKLVTELQESYIKLAEAEEKRDHASTETGRELGRRQSDQIKKRQDELKKRVESTLGKDFANKAVAEAEAEANKLRTAYANDRNEGISTKGLGFGENDDVERTWDTLIAKAQQYQKILYKQQSGGTITVNEAALLQKLSDLYQQAGEKAEEAGEKGQKFNEAVAAAQQAVRDSVISKYSETIGGLTAENKNMPEAYNKQVEELKNNLEQLKNIDFDTTEWKEMVGNLDAGLNNLRTNASMRPVTDSQKAQLDRQMASWMNSNSGAGEFLGQVQRLRDALSNVRAEDEFNGIQSDFEKVRAAAADAGKTGESFGEGLKKRFKSLGQYLLSFASFYRVIGVFKQAFSTVKELDDALVEMRKVSDESLSSLQRYQSLSFNIADEVGTTARQIQQSTADWLRLGESFEEAQKSAKESTILLNVSEFDNIDKATEALVSASQAYKDLDKIDIIDKLNNIGNNFSISTDQLATGLQNSAAVLMTQGNDIDEALALLTAGNVLPEDTEMYLLECI